MKAVNFVLGADLRSGHRGLRKQASTLRIDLGALPAGSAVVFINRARTMLKAYSYNGAVTHIRFDEGERRGIDMNALQEIPRSFAPDGTLDYTKAMRVSLTSRLHARRKEKVAYRI